MPAPRLLLPSQKHPPTGAPPPSLLLRRVADRVLQDFPTPPDFNWGEGVLMIGMMQAGITLKEPNYLGFVQAWADHWHRIGISNLLQQARYCGHWGPGAPLLMLHQHTKDRKYLDMAKQIVAFMQTNAARTPDGFPCHVKQDNQVWLDTLYMTCPVYTRLAPINGDTNLVLEAARLLDLCARRCQNPTNGLFWHVYDHNRGATIGPLWARGNGWVALSYMEVLPLLDRNSATFRKLFADFEPFARSILVTRDPATGLWHTILDHPDTYLETSASAMFLCAFLRANRAGLLHVPNSTLAQTWTALAAKVDLHGRVFDVSGGTDARTDLTRYTNKVRGTYTWGTGAFLLTAAELLAHKN